MKKISKYINWNKMELTHLLNSTRRYDGGKNISWWDVSLNVVTKSPKQCYDKYRFYIKKKSDYDLHFYFNNLLTNVYKDISTSQTVKKSEERRKSFNFLVKSISEHHFLSPEVDELIENDISMKEKMINECQKSKRNYWNEKEIADLLKYYNEEIRYNLVERGLHVWKRISEKIPGRSSKDCRQKIQSLNKSK
jgi:hypothetical protein